MSTVVVPPAPVSHSTLIVTHELSVARVTLTLLPPVYAESAIAYWFAAPFTWQALLPGK